MYNKQIYVNVDKIIEVHGCHGKYIARIFHLKEWRAQL